MENWTVYVFVFSSTLFHPVFGYGHGAPTSTCVNYWHIPYHKDQNNKLMPPQQSTCPYKVLVTSGDGFKPGGTVTVNLTADIDFRGFFLHAALMSTHSTVGEFLDIPDNTQMKECPPGGMYLTHTGTEVKYGFQFIWKAPEDIEENIQFLATIAKDKSTFWIRQESSVVILQHESSTTPSSVANKLVTASTPTYRNQGQIVPSTHWSAVTMMSLYVTKILYG